MPVSLFEQLNLGWFNWGRIPKKAGEPGLLSCKNQFKKGGFQCQDGHE
jgi:hypothetical protein